MTPASRAAGIDGDDGATGTTGPSGPTGPPGPAGSNGLSEYAYVYNLGAQVVPLEGDVTFDSTGVHSSGAGTQQNGGQAISHSPPATS